MNAQKSKVARGTVRRQILLMGVAAALGAGVVQAADIKDLKNIKIVVSQAPGGSVDQIARAFADFVSRETGVTAVVQNKPGGLGMSAANEVAKAAPDGATLLIIMNSNMAQAPVLLKNPPVNPDTDFTPIASFSMGRSIVAVRNGLPVKNVKELIEYARKNPVSAGNFGIGTNWQMVLQHLAETQGAEFNVINYKGGAPMQVDLYAGHIDIASGSLLSMAPAIREGKAIPLVVPGARRTKVFPDVPTWAEEGFTDPIFSGALESALLVGPKGLPPELVERFAQLASRTMKESEAMQNIAAQLDAEDPLTGEALDKHLSQSWKYYRDMTRQLGIEPS